ncbi:MAG: CRTAC1 family protein [Candidatus Acidiferrales bacterium]
MKLLRVCVWVSMLSVFALSGTLAMTTQKASEPSPMAIRLTDAAREAGITVLNVSGGTSKDYLLEVVGNGAAWFDYNNDGLIDLLIVNGSTIEKLKRGGDQMVTLYRNNGNGTFTDVTAESGLTKKGWGMGVCTADYDNDGFEDIYITAYGGNVLFHNNGDGTFADVTQRARIGLSSWSTGCAFGDYDRDGFVDLYVANYVAADVNSTPKRGTSPFCQYLGMDVLCGPRGLRGAPDVLYHNNGDGSFSEVTQAARIHDPGYYGFGVIFGDLNEDGWPDIFVANDSTPNFFFRNDRNGTFSEVGLEAGAALSGDGRPQACMGVDVADYNNDGHLGIFVTNFSQDTSTLYRSNGDGTFTDVTSLAGFGASQLYMGWGTGFVDLDNDGWPDVFVANGHIYPEIDQSGIGSTYLERKQLYQNLGNSRFADITDKIGGGLLLQKSSRGVAFGDYDNDGDLDILIVNLNDRPTLLRNDGGNKNHWITLRLVGTKSNRDAIGAWVRAQVGDRIERAEVRSGGSYISQNDSRVHFGLGRQTEVKRLEIRWPSGLVETYENVRADQFLLATEGQGLRPLKAPRAMPNH